MTTHIRITAINMAAEKKHLNEEWIELVNEGDAAFNGEGCAITVARGSGRPRTATVIKAGLVIQPGERVRLVSGSSGKKSHGDPPAESGDRNFHLFLKASYLDRPGYTVRLVNHQHTEICRFVHGESADGGEAATES